MKQGLFLFFAFCAISNAYAQMDCESIPSCAELGYTQASCPEGSASLKCPFDETKFYCIGSKKLADAPAPVVTPEDWTAECADTIAHCTTLDSNCHCTACESGYLVSNGNCVPECSKSAAVCAKESKIFNADTCTCEACPTNYLFVDGECKKMCTVVANCTTYDSAYDPCTCTACENGYMLTGGKCVVDPCFEKCKIAYPLFAGQANTKAAIDQIGNEALAAYAASQFYVGDKDGDFGQGKWYLPSIGEWMDFYGTDTTEISWIDYGDAQDNPYYSTEYALKGDKMALINDALRTLSGKGVEVRVLDDSQDGYDGYYLWSSTEANDSDVWLVSRNYDGNMFGVGKDGSPSSAYVRCSLLLKDSYNPSAGGIAPKIGDVMYLDKTYGAAADYNGSKTPVGIISSVSTDGRDVTILNLKNLASTIWCTKNKAEEDITGIKALMYDDVWYLA